MTPHRWMMAKEGSKLNLVYVYSCAGCGAVVKRRRRLVSKTSPPPGAVRKAGFLDDCHQERMLAVERIMES